LVYYYYISLVWVYSLLFLPYYPLQYWSGRWISDLQYSLYFCKMCYFCHIYIKFSVFIVFL
jgi:hypothetical protein